MARLQRITTSGTGDHVSPVTQVHEWDGLVRGDSVRLKGRRGTFRFVYHTTVNATGMTWVTVWDDQFISVEPHEVIRLKTQPPRKAG